jgi:hypothetical protein
MGGDLAFRIEALVFVALIDAGMSSAATLSATSSGT